MAKKSKPVKGKKQVEMLVHDEATRRNIPTAELAAIAERIEETDPVAPVRFARRTPLKRGEIRDRDSDLDPQIVWNGVRIRLTKAQIEQLAETGEIEEAKAILETVRKLQPNISVAWLQQSVPYTAEPMERFLGGLRKAGLE